jgi:hypothetical protein
MDWCCTGEFLAADAIFVVLHELGASRASRRGIISTLMPATNGFTTRLTMDTRPSRIAFNPSPRVSASSPRVKSSKTSRTSPAKADIARA